MAAFKARRSSATGEYTGNNLADVTGSGTLDLITNTVNTPYGYPDTAVPAFTVQLGTGKGTFNPVSTTITAPASLRPEWNNRDRRQHHRRRHLRRGRH